MVRQNGRIIGLAALEAPHIFVGIPTSPMLLFFFHTSVFLKKLYDELFSVVTAVPGTTSSQWLSSHAFDIDLTIDIVLLHIVLRLVARHNWRILQQCSCLPQKRVARV